MTIGGSAGRGRGRTAGRRAGAVLVAVVTCAAVAVGAAHPVAADTAGQAAPVQETVSPGGVWIDGSDRLHHAWAVTYGPPPDEAPEPPYPPAELHVTRYLASGALDTSFGADGHRLVARQRTASPCGAMTVDNGASGQAAVSFTPAGDLVVAWDEPRPIGSGVCSVDSTLVRHGLDGTRLAVRSAREALGLPEGIFFGGPTSATADGRVVFGYSGPTATQYALAGVTGSAVASPGGTADQVPGGPVYLSGPTGSGGAFAVTRVVGTTVAPVASVTCPVDGNGWSWGDLDDFQVLPGTGTDVATVCATRGETGPTTLAIRHVGSTTWQRTVTGELTGVGSGAVLGDGRVVLGGTDLARDETVSVEGRIVRLGATGAVEATADRPVGRPDHVVPVGADVVAYTSRLGPEVPGVAGYLPFAPTGPTEPAAPAAPAVVAGDRRVTVTWAAPADGGSPITGYRITPVKDGVARAPIVVGAVTSHVVTGLVNGAAYRFSVAAINAVGRGPESPLSAVVRPAGLPGAPTGVRAAGAGVEQVRVTWVAPTPVPGSPVTGYRVAVWSGGVQFQELEVGAVTSSVVPGLTPGVVFTFRVRAVTAAGAGPWSAESNLVTPPRAPFGSHPAAATRLATEVLGRAPTAAEAAGWVPRLESGALSPGGLVAELRRSGDNASRVDPAVRLYQAYFLRRPDADGLRYWVAQRRGGRSLQSISDFFRRSAEFVALYGELSNREFVELIYTNILGRPGEAGGVTYWTGELDAGRRSRGSVMVGFSEAVEYRAAQASEVEVSVLFILLLGRAPTAAEHTREVAFLDGGGTVTALADRLLATSEYAQRTTP